LPGPEPQDIRLLDLFRKLSDSLTHDNNVAPGEAYLDYSRPLPLCSPTDTSDRILHYFDIIPLLCPTHSYFDDKQGSIEDYAIYQQHPDSKYWFVYPRCKYDHLNNPYRRYRLSRTHAARTVKKILTLKEVCHLDNLKVLATELTFDEDLTLWLASQPGAFDMAWRLLPKWLDVCLAKARGQSATLAAIATLHFWSTKDPKKYHFHFHICWLNYLQVEAFVDPRDGQTHDLVQRPFPINEDGKRVPFTKAQLAQLRASWKRIQVNFARRHRIDCPSLKGDGEVDIYVKYLDLNRERGVASFANRLKYMCRPPIVDYARASNKNPEYPLPTDHLVRYTTKARTFGYWKRLRTMFRHLDASDICKLSPLTGRPMKYLGRKTREEILEHAHGQLGRLDFRKGKAIRGLLTQKDLDTLKSLDYSTYPNAGWYKAHRYDPGALLAARGPP